MNQVKQKNKNSYVLLVDAIDFCLHIDEVLMYIKTKKNIFFMKHNKSKNKIAYNRQ
jgi:hypothetical protein